MTNKTENEPRLAREWSEIAGKKFFQGSERYIKLWNGLTRDRLEDYNIETSRLIGVRTGIKIIARAINDLKSRRQ